MIDLEIPGSGTLHLEALLTDLNGTLAVDGIVPEPVRDRLARVAKILRVVVATADTFGTAETQFDGLGVEVRILTPGFHSAQKEKILEQLGTRRTVVLGNGVNDHQMMARAALGVAVLGREGAAWETLRRSQVVVTDPRDGLDLLLRSNRLVATLRD